MALSGINIQQSLGLLAWPGSSCGGVDGVQAGGFVRSEELTLAKAGSQWWLLTLFLNGYCTFTNPVTSNPQHSAAPNEQRSFSLSPTQWRSLT